MTNLFSDLIPKDAPKPSKSARGGAFSDLIPKAVEHAPGATGQRGANPEQEGEQAANIARKGDMAPGSVVAPDPLLGRAEGVLLNFGGEVGGALGAGVDAVREGITGEGEGLPLAEKYEQRKALLDAQLASAREYLPFQTGLEEITGNIQSAGIPAGKVLQGVGLLGKTIRGAVTGGVVGGIAGAGEGDGLESRLEKGAAGLRQGALVGAVVPPIAAGVGQGIRLVKAAARGATAPVRALADPETFAAQKVAERLGQDQLTPMRVELRLKNRQQLKPDLVMADVGGKNTQGLLRAAANVPSENRERLTRSLTNRQGRQLDRLAEDVGAAFGDPKSFNSTVEGVALARKQNAKPLFDDAFKTGTPFSVPLQNVLGRPLMRRLVARAEDAAANRGEKFQSIFAQQVPGTNKFKFARVPDTEALHRIKMEIDSAISQIKRREETGLGNVQLRDLTILKKDLLSAIQNPKYKAALKQYAGDSAAVNALDEGHDEFLKMEPDAIGARLKEMSSAEAELARLGLARKVVSQLRDSGRTGVNRADILQSPKYLSRLRAAFKDTQSGRDFLRKVALEQKMFKTKAAVEGNSTTQAQQIEGMEGGVEAQNVREAIDMGTKLARGDTVGALASWLSRAKNTMTGLRPEVADQIIKMLTSKDPAMIRRAQRLVEAEINKISRRQGTAGRVEQGVNIGGFTAIPSYVSGGQ